MTQHPNRESEYETAPLQSERMLKSVWWLMYLCCNKPRFARLPDVVLQSVAMDARYSAAMPAVRQDLFRNVVSGSDLKVLRLILNLIAQQRIVSAAVMSAPLHEDNLWIAAEWSGCIVVERAEIGGIGSEINWLQPEGEDSERSLVIFRVPEEITSSLEEANDFTHEGEVGALVRERPHKFYGKLADPLTGGASALYAAGFEAARARELPKDRIVVASPEALGFKLDNGNNSVVAWQKKSFISVEAVGFSRSSIEEVSRLLADHEVDVTRDDLGTEVRCVAPRGIGPCRRLGAAGP